MGSKRRALITARDRELLEFLAEHRTLVTLQTAQCLRVTEATAARRIAKLKDQGLAATWSVFDGESKLVWISQRGLRAIDRRLPEPVPSLRQLRHDVGVGWLWLAARDGAFGRLEQIVSEREMRSADARPDRDDVRYGVGIWHTAGRGPGAQHHYPDLMLQTASGHRVAIELELSGKGDRRLEEIMFGYSIDRRYDRVLYLVESRQLGERVRRAARTAGVEDLVRVQLTTGEIAGAPATPTAHRSRQRALPHSRSLTTARGLPRARSAAPSVELAP